jgi:AcrR family transcriptional regulator
MRGIPSRGRGTAARATSEKALLDAFEGLLQRQGAAGVGVNSVLGSAKVGKRLLYRYFGDLEGLAQAWSKNRRDPLELGRRIGRLRRSIAPLSKPRRTAVVLEDYAQKLREHPWAIQVLLAELAQPAQLGKAMRDIRLEIGAGHEALLVESKAFEGSEWMQFGFVLHAAATYLAMRARLAPDYNGIDLGSRQGWAAAMEMLQTVARLAEPKVAGVRRTRKAPARRARAKSPGRSGAS